MPACVVQEPSHHAIAVATVFASQFDDILGQAVLVGPALRNLALGGSVLAENPAGAALTHAVRLPDAVNTPSAARRA